MAPRPAHFQKKTVDDVVKLMDLICSKPTYIAIFYSILEGGSEYDLFARALLSYSNATGTTMNILQNVITSEFEANVGTPTSIMRGNTAASRIVGLFCRQRGGEYLKKTLAPVISAIVGNKKINFEIDESKIEGENVEQQRQENLAQLTTFAENIISLINTPEAILEMPRDIKALAYHIRELAHEYCDDNTMLLVGGFVMLRFINPALLTPDYYNLVPPGSLTIKNRRNLTLLCKIIQNVSNQSLCNEDWMIECNPFIERNLSSLEEFYKHVLMDPSQESPDQIPFEDLSSKQEDREEVDPHAIEVEAFQFFDEIFSERKTDLLEIFSKQPHEIRIEKNAMEIVELLSEYGEDPPEPIQLVLYYSPLCPFSRIVWLFCLETGIPITTHKIDLLKEDQALDQAYKKFSQLSPSLQTPLLIDGDFVLEESDAICLYLCERFFVGYHWLPKADLTAQSKIYQQLDWMHQAVHFPILRLWEACKNPAPENLHYAQYRDLIDNLDLLDRFYAEEHARLELSTEAPFLQGNSPSLVDLFVVVILSFSQLIHGFGVSRFPNLKRAFITYITKQAPKLWKQINYEFEGFFKYVITATTTDNLPQVNQMILFQETPHTIFEMVLDPENDIFLFLASKTISTKTNAKLKRGLKKMDGSTIDAAGSGTEEESTEAPYVVNLDIGGEFNIRGREGTNLLLVPGKKIVQVSRMSDWPASHLSTVIFSLEKTEDSKALLHFSEINCPVENFKLQEENWSKFWKKINGVRVETIRQVVFFKLKTPNQMFTTLTDWKVLAKALKGKVKEESDGGAFMHNNKVFAKTRSTIPNREIVQSWRGTDWPDNLFSNVVMHLEAYEGGCKITCTVQMVPFEKVKAAEKLWKSSMWKKLGGVVCDTITQTITFRMPPADVCNMWLDGNILTQKLKSKCVASKDAGSQVVMTHMKGTTIKYEPGKQIIQRLSHKDWPQHVSTVKLLFREVENGTEMSLIHENIPSSFLKATADMWHTEFWEKLEGIQTGNLLSSIILADTTPEVLYESLLDKDKMALLTGGDCTISPKEGATVSLYDKFVKGTITHLEKNSGITMSVRNFNWPFGHTSEVIYQFDEFQGGKGTILTLRQNRVPINFMEDVTKRNEDFCKQLKKTKLTK